MKNKEHDSKEKEKARFKKILISMYPLFVAIGFFLFVQLILIGFNIKMINISGQSMMPTYHDGTFLLLKAQKAKTDDIIVFTPPKTWSNDDGQKKYIKRIIAEPGDTLTISKDVIYVNLKPIKNISGDKYKSIDPITVTIPEHNYFVMGDNYNNSNDSLYEYSKGNKDFLIKEKTIFTTGTNVLKIRYKFGD